MIFAIVWDLIPKYMKKMGLSKTAFCKKCHISGRTYERLIERDEEISLAVFAKISAATGIPFLSFMVAVEKDKLK